MITEQDLQAAIAECQGQRNPNANTCIKLAAFYTIRNEMFGKPEQLESNVSEFPTYSYAAPPETTAETTIAYNSGTEFSDAIHGKDAETVWAIMDELMDVLKVTHPRLYDGTMNQIRFG